jgi:AcrR family transcriptional regulator
MLNEQIGPGRARVAQKEKTRLAVLEAARAEFERVGFDGANVRAIAARAQVSAGTVLHYYRDKKELLHAALFDALDQALTRAIGRLTDGPIEGQFDALGKAVFRFYAKRPTLSRTLLKESLFADPPWAQRFSAQVSRVAQAMTRLTEAAIAREELRAELDPRLVAVAWFSFFYFALIAWVQGAQRHPARLCSALMRQHLAGLRVTPPLTRKAP